MTITTTEHATQAADPAAGGVAQGPDVAGRSLRQIAWGRIRRDRVAMVCLVVLAVIILVAVFAPLINRAMGLSITKFDTKLLDSTGGAPLGHLGGITWKHPFGVEPGTGRDNFARLLIGARLSLMISAISTVLTVVLGIVIGIVAGYSRGIWDGLLGRFMDLLLSFPQLLILLALSRPLEQRFTESFGMSQEVAAITYIILVLSVFQWPYLARIVRGQVLSLREREFVEAALSLGSPRRRILFREILPNLWAPVIVYSTLLLPTFIAAEATLSYLGVGLVPPTPSWGSMLSESVQFYTTDPAFLFIPGAFLFIVVLSFNLLGDSVRDALDPRAGRS